MKVHLLLSQYHYCELDSSWKVMAHGDALEGKWRGNWRMEWVASTLHTPSEHGVSSITTAEVHTSATSSRLNWSPCRFKWTCPFRWKTKSGFWECKGKGKVIPLQARCGPESRGIALLFYKGVSGQQHVPAVLYPGKDPVPILREAGWAPGPVWADGKSCPHGVSARVPSHFFYRARTV